MTSRERAPWFAWTSTPTVKPPKAVASTRDDVPMPPLKPWQIMPVPPPTLPSLTEASLASRQRIVDVVGGDVRAVDVVEHAVPRLGDDGQRPPVVAGALCRLDPHERVANDADRMGIGQRDRGGEQTGLFDPVTSRHLPVAIETMNAGEHRTRRWRFETRDDHGDTGTDRPASRPRDAPFPAISVRCPTATQGTSTIRSSPRYAQMR